MHPDCVNCNERRNCINGAMCMRIKTYIELTDKKLCEDENKE